jgi:hypothetical protein
LEARLLVGFCAVLVLAPLSAWLAVARERSGGWQGWDAWRRLRLWLAVLVFGKVLMRDGLSVFLAVLVASLLFPLTRIALAPLALALNRHR